MTRLFTIAYLIVGLIYLSAYLDQPEARDYCPKFEPYLRGTNDCTRIPTEAIPLCPFPGGSQISGLVDTTITHLSDTSNRILTW